jgi:glycosyltransferase involved in cell wall biosynthesis
MDGGSTDNSVEIIKKYDPWITYWESKKDRGQAHAINKGFKRATGEIIAWLNSDDTYLPSAIKEAAKYLATHSDVAMVYGNCVIVGEEGNPSKLKSEIGAVLGSKIMDHIDTRRQEIAQDMFGEGVQYSGFSSYETKMIKLADKIVNVTKEGDSINKMAKGISKQINNGEGISPKQAEWIANTWKSFKK